MALPIQKDRGFSLIELLVVLVIVGALSVVGVMMIGDRRGSGVRSVMDEIEGVLAAAQKGTAASNRDIYLSANGRWLDGTLILDGRPLRPPPETSNPPVAGDLIPGDPPPTDANGPTTAKRVGGASECFRARPNTDRDHMSAGVVVDNGPWYATTLGATPALSAVPPISTQIDFTNALANPLFKSTGVTTVVVNGQTGRFVTGFCVVVVGLANGVPLRDAPIGILVVPQNSSSVYKFYKADQSSTWRKL